MFDTEALYQQAGQELLGRRGRLFDDALRSQMMGRPGPVAMQLLVDYHSLAESAADLLSESEAIFARLITSALRPMPGLHDLMDRLDAAGIAYGVATSSRRRFAEEILQRGAVHERVQFVLTGEDVEHGKPHPEIYWKAAERMGIRAAEMMVLEDSANGCAAAVAAGAVTVAVPGPHSQDHCFDGVALVATSLIDPRMLGWIGVGNPDSGVRNQESGDLRSEI